MPSILPQLIINGLIAGSIYALAASGFSLVYYVMKFQYFSQGAIMAIAAYSFFTFFAVMKIDIAFSIFLTLAVAALSALLTNWLVYKPLRKRKATPTILLISSIVLLLFASSLVLAIFGASTKTIEAGKLSKTLDLGFATITSLQLTIITVTTLLFLLLLFILKKTKLGKAMRALADNKQVAQIVGVNPEKIYIYTFAISAALGAFAGILIGMEQNLYPRMGTPIIVKGFISAVVGGINSVPATLAGGLFIGLAENIGIWVLPSYFKDIISFTILLIFLLLRPQGIFGVRMRDDS